MKKSTPIRFQFISIFSLLVLFPILFLGIGFNILFTKSVNTRIQNEQRLVLSSIQRVIMERHIRDMEGVLNVYAEDPDLPLVFDNPEAAERIELQWNSLRKIFPSRPYIYYGDEKNRIIVSPSWDPPEEFIMHQRPWYLAGSEQESIVWVQPYVEYITGDIIVTAVRGIKDSSGTFVGVLAVDTWLSDILELLDRESSVQSELILMLTAQGEIASINHPESALLENIRKPETIRKLQSGNPLERVNLLGETYYVSSQKISRLNITLLSLMPDKITQKEKSLSRWMALVIAVIALALASLAGFFLSRMYVGNIENLNRFMTRVEEGDYSPENCVSGGREFQEMNRRLNKMVGSLSASIESLETISNIDMLSRIYNRRYVMRHLKDHTAVKGTSILLLDIDDFKKINDGFGHMVGDEVISRMGSLLKEHFGEPCIAGRYGGEEFIVITDKISWEDFVRISEKFLKRCESLKWRESTLRVTMSGGLSELQPDEPLDKCLNRVDQALYKSKHKGKNQVTQMRS